MAARIGRGLGGDAVLAYVRSESSVERLFLERAAVRALSQERQADERRLRRLVEVLG